MQFATHGSNSRRAFWSRVGLTGFVACACIVCSGSGNNGGERVLSSPVLSTHDSIAPNSVPIWIYVGPTLPNQSAEGRIVIKPAAVATVTLTYLPANKINAGSGDFRTSVQTSADGFASFKIPVTNTCVPAGKKCAKVAVIAAIVDDDGEITHLGTDTLLVHTP